jgi:glycosyltransferase involved in cell wall biosynthesis
LKQVKSLIIQHSQSIVIVTPVFNDWKSFFHLLHAIDDCVCTWKVQVRVIAVDDGSTENSLLSLGNLEYIDRVEVVSLVCNLGHQRAIAVGLCEAFHQEGFDAVIVMDCDGEDAPEAIDSLLQAFRENSNRIIVAQRGKRSETVSFRVFYLMYRTLFWGLTGRVIDFGNFCLIPQPLLQRVVYLPDIWNNLAAALTKSRSPLYKVRINRGRRYAGQSKMNLISLIIHGLSAVSVYSDVVFVRVAILFTILSVLVATGIVVVVLLRLVTNLAIPGWASYVTGLLSIILLQTLLFSAGATFSLLSRRSILSVVPALDARRYIREWSVIHEL